MGKIEEHIARKFALEEQQRRERYLRARAQEAQEARVAQARLDQEESRQRASDQRLVEMKKRWAEAAEHVDSLRMDGYRSAGGRVDQWRTRHAAAHAASTAADDQKVQKLQQAFVKKDERFRQWRVDTDTRLAQRAVEIAGLRKAASVRFLGERSRSMGQLEGYALLEQTPPVQTPLAFHRAPEGVAAHSISPLRGRRPAPRTLKFHSLAPCRASRVPLRV